MTTAGVDVPGNPSTQGLEGFDVSEGRTRSADGSGFDSPQVHVNLTEEQEKDLDEAAKKFARTKGGK